MLRPSGEEFQEDLCDENIIMRQKVNAVQGCKAAGKGPSIEELTATGRVLRRE